MSKLKKKSLFTFIISAFALFISLSSSSINSNFNYHEFSQLPVVNNGRVKPIDSVARQAMIMISGKQSVKINNEKVEPIVWLLDVISRPEIADTQKVFFIHNPDLKTLLGIEDEKQKFVSFNQLFPKRDILKSQAEKARELKAQQRNVYQRAVVNLYDRLYFYHKLKHSYFTESITDLDSYFENLKMLSSEQAGAVERFESKKKLTLNDKALFQFLNQVFTDSSYSMSVTQVLPIPNFDEKTTWISSGQSIHFYLATHNLSPYLEHYLKLLSAYKKQDSALFNTKLNQLHQLLNTDLKTSMYKVKFETFFNDIQPFYKSMILYVLSFLALCFSWIIFQAPLGSIASQLLNWAFLVHTFGLLSRMLLQWRPPVTNLYSSAVFVGWVAVLLGIYLEKRFRNKMGIFIANAVGFMSLIIAHHLSMTGSDTLEMMQAVLDSNFWLSTHVITITIGYSAVYLAGFMGIIYIFRDKFKTMPLLGDKIQKDLFKMCFGIICFALFFSFVGTVLGGIWADQSWGRFWGWDPKENGALLIVLWCAIMLHARLGGFIKEKGFMIASVFGNIITSFSWFGVNMLGVGLHSYGFMDKAFVWLFAFILSQITIILFGIIPSKK